MKAIFDQLSYRSSRLVTTRYSTSFTLGIMGLNRKLHNPIYSIYGFVRLADEIVDSFHGYPKEELLSEFRDETFKAIDRRISTNPILNSFQETVHQYDIDLELIRIFLNSMEMDLQTVEFNLQKFEEYILGSAEVVGLMCLKVFVDGDVEKYESFKASAMKLGSAFQKINFLRDLNADYNDLGRSYFPSVDLSQFSDSIKISIEQDIEADFRAGFEGIIRLPKGARFGVYIAYMYYYSLFRKIKRTPSSSIFRQRIRISNLNKYGLFVSSYFRHSLNLL